jgi:hypothetical protein
MAQITGGPHRGHAAGDTDVEKAASQLVSDIKYKVGLELKRKGGASHLNPAQVAQMYMQKLAASSAKGPVKAIAKKKLGGLKEEYNIDKLVQESVVNALSKVFVEGIEEPAAPNEYLLQLEETEEKKYKIRVTDKKTGNTYVRMATRAKIAELRANPNISSVEMTSYGEPSESERTTGSRTAAAKAGKDYDHDGEIESPAKEHAGAVHNAIQRKRGGVPDGKDTSSVKEEFIGEEGQDQNQQKLDIKKGIKNKVDIFPDSKIREAMEIQNTSQPSALQKFRDLQKPNPALDAKRKQQVMLQKKVEMDKLAQLNKGVPLTQSYQPEGESIEEVAPPGMEGTVRAMKNHPELSKGKTKEGKKKNIYALAWYMKNKGYKSHRTASGAMKEEADCGCDDKKTEVSAEDPREIPTKVNLVKNKLRAMGLKMSYEPEGEVIGEEDYDRMKDRRQEVGGMGANVDQKPAKTNGSSKPYDPKKDAQTNKKAVNLVRQSIIAKHGKGALM